MSLTWEGFHPVKRRVTALLHQVSPVLLPCVEMRNWNVYCIFDPGYLHLQNIPQKGIVLKLASNCDANSHWVYPLWSSISLFVFQIPTFLIDETENRWEMNDAVPDSQHGKCRQCKKKFFIIIVLFFSTFTSHMFLNKDRSMDTANLGY